MRRPIHWKEIARKLGMVGALVGIGLLNGCTADLSVDPPRPTPTRHVVRGLVTSAATGRPIEGVKMVGESGFLTFIGWWCARLPACFVER